MRYMLDTDICSYIVKRRSDLVYARFSQMHRDDMCISAITYAELMHGMKYMQPHSRTALSLSGFLSGMQVEAWADAAAEEFAGIAYHLQGEGTPIGTMDMQIAAHSLSLKATLVSNNQKHFHRVPGLKVENWA